MRNRWNVVARAGTLGGWVVFALACGGERESESPGAAAPALEDVVRETCEDNPLLAGCAPQTAPPSPADPGGRTSGSESGPASEFELARAAAENVLRANCGQCHGPALTPATARAGMNYIDNVDALVENGKLVPLDSAASPIVRRMSDGSMPPLNSSGPRPSPRDIDVVAEFIDNPAFWPEQRAAPTCDGQLISFDELHSIMLQDLRIQDSDDRPFSRYVTFTNRYNAGVCAESLDRERLALTKLVNSLSTRTRLVPPVAVDRERLIYRLDLRDYNWNRQVEVDGQVFPDAWEAILAGSPYAIPFVGDQADDLREDTLTDVPWLNADALVDAAGIGNLYYALIGVDVSEALSSFISGQLGIDVDANIGGGDAVRAGTSRSRISRKDRVIERHEIEVRQGSFWQSFDFEPGVASDSIFSNPLGFSAGGTEAIFTLPNGMIGFLIGDDDGNIVPESNLLLDTFQDDFIARTSVSCSNCHAQGFNPVVDEVGPFVRDNRFRFGREEVEVVAEIYPSVSDFARIIETDSRRYLETLRRLGLPLTGPEPIAAAYVQFNLDVDLAAAAGDLGLTPAALRADLNLLDPALAVLEQLRLDRDAFSALFEESLCIMQRVSRNQPDPERCEGLLAAR